MSAVSGGNCSAAAAASFVNESMAFVAFSVGLAMVDAVIICGNTLVILAVLTSHSLRSVTSLLVSSLAVADLLVGVLVLPFSIANEVLGHVWVFGAVWCQIWLAVDVWMCTASIYNLVVISIERYVAILKPLHYPTIVTSTRGKLAVCGAWVLSFSISFPPMVFNWSEAFSAPLHCFCTPLDNSPAYIVFSSTMSFFLPMAIICFVYMRIYGVVRKIAKEDEARSAEVREWTPMVGRSADGNGPRVLVNLGAEGEDTDAEEEWTRAERGALLDPSSLTNGLSVPRVPSATSIASSALGTPVTAVGTVSYRPTPSAARILTRLGKTLSRHSSSPPLPPPLPPDNGTHHHHNPRSERRRMQSRMSAELKAVKMVAVVTGVFIACWLGFSLIYLLRAFPFCKNKPDCIPDNVFSVFFWLGYANSAINPIVRKLYAVFNRQFRRAFRALLTCSSNH